MRDSSGGAAGFKLESARDSEFKVGRSVGKPYCGDGEAGHQGGMVGLGSHYVGAAQVRVSDRLAAAFTIRGVREGGAR